MTQLPLFDLPPAEPCEPAKPRIAANPGNRPYGKGRPCTPSDPGTGPQGETCGGCLFLRRIQSRSGKTFLKCGVMRHAWTRGGGTDVKAKWPACGEWYPKDQVKIRIPVVAHKGMAVSAAVFYRKKDGEPKSEWAAPIDTLADLWIWYDYHVENGWLSLHPPRVSTARGYEVITG